MSEMVRKQIYITRRQEMLLKRLARLRGVSEAEIIRKALEKEMVTPMSVETEQRDSRKALEELLQLALSRKNLPSSGEPYRWNREEIYEERERRWTIRDREE